MPIQYARVLIGKNRTQQANRQLGYALTCVAGAINAGGFLAVRQYTSHVTGMVSSIADHLILGAHELALDALIAVISFVLGAMTSAILINYSQRRGFESQYALPLLYEAFLLLIFGGLGSQLHEIETFFIPLTVMLLCFIMGLQNALITKISKAEIRTTHLTGIVTDIGIELGKLLYINQANELEKPRVQANREKLTIHGTLLVCFIVGAFLGALSFSRLGYVSTLPLALVLAFLASIPALDDVFQFRKREKKQ